MENKRLQIDTALVKRLIASQFPQWTHLPIRPVSQSGWDNRTFHLGNEMSVRLPSSAEYANQVETEHRWLPKLAPHLPLPIPSPIAIGKPTSDYPYPWSLYRWLEGESAAPEMINSANDFAKSLGGFLRALQSIDTTGGPAAGAHNFYRGGPLTNYDQQTRDAITKLKHKIDAKAATNIWDAALATQWKKTPVWVHGDISLGNLLVRDGKLCAVIDFGQLAIGDPACDLAIAWTFFNDENRVAFQDVLKLDHDTWLRGKAWALWKTLITAAGFTNPENAESRDCWRIIEEIIRKLN